jgi:5'-nucleotidase (lipoprotein e(P4) family)
MSRTRVCCLCLAIGTVGFLAGNFVAGRPTNAEDLPAPRNVNLESPPHRSLDANLWMQISAEYRACCYQAYNLARRRMIEKLHDAPPHGWAKPPAVVLDLDETVLDNSRFQTRLIRNGLTFDEKTWDDWEKTGFAQVGLVPGAKGFIDEAKRLGVRLVYITNRKQKQDFRDGTLQALERLGIEIAGRDLLCAEETSDKTARRAEAESRYTVLLYIGDNLRDLHEGDFRSTLDNARPGKGSDDPAKLREAIVKRAYAVDRCADLFGREWIILPNPAYGEWAKVLGRGEKDKDLLMGQPAPR